MKNLINENLIDSTLLFDFNSIIKKLELSESIFAYEPFNLGFNLNPEEIYLVIDYEFYGNYLIKILDNHCSALVLKGYKLGNNISNSKIIARNPSSSIEEINSIKYFKLVKSNIQVNFINDDNLNIRKSPSKSYTAKDYYLYSGTPLHTNSNHNEKILKIMDRLIEMHFNNSYSKKSPSESVNSTLINLNEILLKINNSGKSLNEVSVPKQTNNYEELMKMKKWKNELYSMLF